MYLCVCVCMRARACVCVCVRARAIFFFRAELSFSSCCCPQCRSNLAEDSIPLRAAHQALTKTKKRFFFNWMAAISQSGVQCRILPPSLHAGSVWGLRLLPGDWRGEGRKGQAGGETFKQVLYFVDFIVPVKIFPV